MGLSLRKPGFQLGIHVWRDSEGHPRLTAGGHYRFSLMFAVGEYTAEFDGLRVDKRFTAVLPVLAAAGHGEGTHVISRLSPELQRFLLDQVRAAVTARPERPRWPR